MLHYTSDSSYRLLRVLWKLVIMLLSSCIALVSMTRTHVHKEVKQYSHCMLIQATTIDSTSTRSDLHLQFQKLKTTREVLFLIHVGRKVFEFIKVIITGRPLIDCRSIAGMKTFTYLLLGIIISATISCKKDNKLFLTTSLNVVNASPGIANAKVKTPNANGYYNQLTGVNFGKNAVFMLPAGSASVTIASSLDTTKPFYNNTFTSAAGETNSLFIAGVGSNDIVLNKDIIPIYSDSSFGVRFINLNPNSNPVNVTLSISSTTNELSGVAYKSISNFKTYGAKSTNPSTYTFQVRDAGGVLIASSAALSRTTLLQHNVTLVFKGMIGGTGTSAPSVFTVNNY